MRGILINNDTHTGNDLNLVMTEKNLPPPTVQTYSVDIPGRNGSLDLSEFLTGEVAYSNRQLIFKFIGDGSRETVLNLINTMCLYHGQEIRITTDDYPDWYYIGRAAVTYTDNWNYAEFEISVDALPFRYSINPKVYEFAINGTKELSINIIGQSVIPTITVDDETTVVIGDTRLSISAGTYTSTSLKLTKGTNKLTFEGNGNVTMTYREAVI